MYYKRFENCIPVKGANRSIICDLQRGEFDFIPNVLFDILSKEYFSLEILLREYGVEHQDTINEYIEFLLHKEYCFPIDFENIKNFPKLNLDWDTPFPISHAIVEIDNRGLIPFQKIISQLEELGCKFIEIKSYDTLDIKILETFLSLFDGSIISSIDLYLKYGSDIFNESICIDLIKKYYRLNDVFLHSALETKLVKTHNSTRLFLLEEKLDGSHHCGKISPTYFAINIQTFTESQKHNSCLNRKISIDANGDIKNCPSFFKSYGNVKTTSLKEAVEMPGFKDVWYIYKDQVDICKDCEFRYICTDCRAYIQNSNIYSKPAKCSYNPYTAVWGEYNSTNNTLYNK